MLNKFEWDPPGAKSKKELMDVLFFAAAGLKTQVLQSRTLSEDKLSQARNRLSEIADELTRLQQDVGIS